MKQEELIIKYEEYLEQNPIILPNSYIATARLISLHIDTLMVRLNAISTIITTDADKYLWLGTRDDRTCPICRPKISTIITITTIPTDIISILPPVHPSCRCYLKPLFNRN